MRVGEEIAPRVAFGQALVPLGAEYPRMLVLDADVGPSTQTQIFATAYPDRFIEVGIAEQNMAGIAAGLASVGFVPWISAFAIFLTLRSGDQLRNSIAHPRANVKINGSYGGLPTGRAGATHSAVEDLAIMRAMPNMTVMVPADARETEACMRLAMDIEGPVYLRTVRCPVPVVFPEGHSVKLGKAVQIREGRDVAVVSTGMMLSRAMEAARILEGRGLSVRLLHMPTIKPIDAEALREASETCGAILTVENHSVVGGLGGAVCESVAEFASCRVRRLGFPDVFMESGDDERIFSMYGLDAAGIAAAAEALAREVGGAS
jgi:transketolase